MSDQIQKPRRRILNAYVLFWVFGATFAAIYLAVLGTHPDMFASAKSGPDLEQQLAQTQHDMTRAFADLDPLKQSVGQIKADVDTLKTAQQQASDRDQLLLDKVASIESAAMQPKVAQAETAAPAAKVQTAHKTIAAGPKASEDVVAVAPGKPLEVAVVAPVKPQKPQKPIAAAPKSTAIETGSIAHKADKAPAAAAAATKPAQVGLLLGSAPSVDAVKLNWSILNDRHADAVRDLHPRYVAQGKGGERTYALLAGPVASPEQAKTLCKLMVDRGLACEVSAYRGTAF
jgi:hypothetical protein